ncbi:hypothetical protein PCL_01519 [Purpureocillium lilacinum]|uniref:Uncharacterized protein n=1 Tax=Purpureocillium lilacinum TaxID=33203 RepID=A0A2U3E3T7_PURLI|nr:hypothetical protein PCL_01519 [Purpureocillium lilacinum]
MPTTPFPNAMPVQADRTCNIALTRWSRPRPGARPARAPCAARPWWHAWVSQPPTHLLIPDAGESGALAMRFVQDLEDTPPPGPKPFGCPPPLSPRSSSRCGPRAREALARSRRVSDALRLGFARWREGKFAKLLRTLTRPPTHARHPPARGGGPGPSWQNGLLVHKKSGTCSTSKSPHEAELPATVQNSRSLINTTATLLPGTFDDTIRSSSPRCSCWLNQVILIPDVVPSPISVTRTTRPGHLLHQPSGPYKPSTSASATRLGLDVNSSSPSWFSYSTIGHPPRLPGLLSTPLPLDDGSLLQPPPCATTSMCVQPSSWSHHRKELSCQHHYHLVESWCSKYIETERRCPPTVVSKQYCRLPRTTATEQPPVGEADTAAATQDDAVPVPHLGSLCDQAAANRALGLRIIWAAAVQRCIVGSTAARPSPPVVWWLRVGPAWTSTDAGATRLQSSTNRAQSAAHHAPQKGAHEAPGT